jgi:hypothetical protein
VSYGPEQAKQTLLELATLAGQVDVLIAYVPSASMGTAIEMWQAHAAGTRILTISPMADNWVIKFLSDRVFATMAKFEEFMASDGLAELSALTNDGRARPAQES